MVLMAAADELELMHMVATAAAIDDRPCGLRYPRGEGMGLALPERGTPLEVGRGRILREGTRIAILSYGTRLQECLVAGQELAAGASRAPWQMRALPSRSMWRWSSGWRANTPYS